MKIISYRPAYQKHFERLNKAWLNKYFEVEPLDEKLLAQPEETILKNGGQILFVEYQGQIIGTVALVFIKHGVYELAKMAVDESFQGLGAGTFLCRSAIEKAKELNYERLILFTNSKLKTAINIYHKLGFKAIPLGEQQFKRAEIKMELLLQPGTSDKWFDRKFAFDFGMEVYESLLERFKEAPAMFRQISQKLPDEVQDLKPGNKWSVKENIGHLMLLEPLWHTRFEEIKKESFKMSPADLSNRATDEMDFNTFSLQDLINSFAKQRAKNISFLNSLQQNDFLKRSIHPRLGHPMRMVDMMYFVSEHDQHHLKAISNIINAHKEQGGYSNFRL